MEKPVAVDGPGCRVVYAAGEEATKKNLKVAAGTQRRHRPSYIETVKRIRDRGVAAVLISHNMRQVLEVADRIEVLRLGRRVARFDGKSATIEQLVSAMTGGIAEEGAA